MRIAVMQPYFFPYIGYFQLVNAVDTFVFYDDVNFIKGGWINRNRILLNGLPGYISIACKGISSFKTIRDTEYELDDRQYNVLIKKVEQNYAKAPYKVEILNIVTEVLKGRKGSIADVAAKSVTEVSDYLGLNTEFKFSSGHFSESKGVDKLDRLVSICKKENVLDYINPIGGIDIYDKKAFREHGIEMFFLQSEKIEYRQFGSNFHPNLSILDVLMFNSKEEIVSKFLNEFKLI